MLATQPRSGGTAVERTSMRHRTILATVDVRLDGYRHVVVVEPDVAAPGDTGT